MSRFGGGADRHVAAMKYTLYMLAGGSLLLFAFIMLALGHAQNSNLPLPQGLSFSMTDWLQSGISPQLQVPVFFMFLLGFGTKIPLVPLHTWLPKAASDGPMQIVALLLGLKLGVYGLLRFMLPLLPDAVEQYQRILAISGALTLVYGGVIALQQSNLRGLLAYAGLSHVGLVIMGIATLNSQGVQGAVLQLFNFTLIAFSLMLMTNSLHQRTGSTELLHLGGIATVMPRFAVLFVLFMLASMGAPLTAGFSAELLLLIGNFKAHPGLGITALAGAVILAAAVISWSRKALWGSIKRQQNNYLQDLLPLEFRFFMLFAVLVILFGLFPQLLLDYIGTAVFYPE
jgi:NADH-quinone oxidoreductase subunit M